MWTVLLQIDRTNEGDRGEVPHKGSPLDTLCYYKKKQKRMRVNIIHLKSEKFINPKSKQYDQSSGKKPD